MAESLAGVEERRRLVGTVLTLPGATAAERLAERFDLVWIVQGGRAGRADGSLLL